MSCPVCGHPDGACAGNVPYNERQIIDMGGVRTVRGPERVPKHRPSRLGKAGYVGENRGTVEVYDPNAPHVRFVSGEETAAIEEEITAQGGSDLSEPMGEPHITEEIAASDSGAGELASPAAGDPAPRRRRKKADA